MSTNNLNALGGLGKRLVRDNILEEEAALLAHEEATKSNVRFVTYLVSNQQASALDIALAASDEFGVPFLMLDAMDPEVLPKDTVSEKLIRKHNALPLVKRSNRLFVGVSDPTNLLGIDEIKFNTGLSTEIVLVEDDKLTAMIEAFLDGGNVLDDLEDELGDLDVEGGGIEDEEASEEDAPIVKFVNKILLDAIRGGASDIHFEPYEKAYRVRFRKDGILREVSRPPNSQAAKIAARLKVMSSMDISERRIPQDGRIKLKLSKRRAIDFRVNTLPTLWGEKICLRILDPDSAKLGIDMLGYEDDQKRLFMDALHQPQGMILVTGPTGSGKTVSLYTGLNILNTPERNISTAEDPVEINLEGINQVNVNSKVGLDFSSALRSFLRQDPDIVMVGEIRDLVTAEIAIKAAQTGHLVLSTLHTNSAPETLTRLRNMGIPSFNIATSVSLIIAQRLGRRLCNHCKEPADIPIPTLLEFGFTQEQAETAALMGPIGCEKCSNDGYKGRVGIYEVVKITEPIARIIMEDGNAIQIADQCRAEGFSDLPNSGIRKALDGVTSLEEIHRVTTGH